MTTEMFTKEEFEKALPGMAVCRGLEQGEYAYELPVSATAKIIIRSSVGENGFAAETGEDSIRAWLARDTDEPIASKSQMYVTRVKNWQNRLYSVLEKLVVLHRRAGNCPVCKNAMGIYFSDKKRVYYFRCWSCNEWGKGKPFQNIDISDAEKSWFQDFFYKSAREADVQEHVVESASNEESGDKQVFTQEDIDRNPTNDFDLGFLGDEVSAFQSVEFDYSRLDEFQKKVVENLGRGPHVVEACPGSGKTYTLENLISAMLMSGIDSSRIGAFTFSRKAAEEMRRRIAKTIWPDISSADLDYLTNPQDNNNYSASRRSWVEEDPRRIFIVDWVCTIHALAYRLLKRAGYDFGVLSGRNEFEAKELIKDTLLELNWDESPKSVSAWIGHAIINLVEPNGSERWFSNQLASIGGPIWTARNLEEVYGRYMGFLKSRNLLDFDLMQARVIWLIDNNPTFKKDIQGMFDYILVDEAQDTAPIQTKILFTLAERTRNIMLCGDVDQSMYGFRGAVPEILRDEFSNYWGNDVQRFVLPTNYRSTQAIITSAAKLIAQNYVSETQYMKPFGYRNGAEVGEPVEKLTFDRFDDMSLEIARIVKESENPGHWFILSRTRAECAKIHTELIETGIPAINKVGGLLFGAPHIRKVLAYARLACNYQDARNDMSILEEIANVATIHFKAPMTRRRHLTGCYAKPWENCGCPILMEEDVDYSHASFYGKKSLQEAQNWNGIVSQQFDRNRGGYPTLKSKGASDLVYFVNRLEKLSSDALAALNVIISDCVLPWLAADEGISTDDLSENGKVEEFSVLLGMVEIGESLENFLTRMDNISSRDGQSEDESVLVGTFHWSKGAERPCVVVNLTRCPVVPPKQDPGRLPVGGEVDLFEERRLAFVGITRAKYQAHVFSSQEWDGKDMPVSEFFGEI